LENLNLYKKAGQGHKKSVLLQVLIITIFSGMAILNRDYTGELTIEESHHLNEFLLKLLRLSNQRKVSLLYRGDKLENLFSRLGLTYWPNNPDFETLLIRLFTVGEKGRHYYITWVRYPYSGTLWLDIENPEKEDFNQEAEEILDISRAHSILKR